MRRLIFAPVVLLLLFVSFFQPACLQTGGCLQTDDLGTLVWSPQTSAWWPDKYYHKPLSLTFQSENGATKTFVLTALDTLTSASHFVDTPCPDQQEDSTRTYFRWNKLAARLMSADSFAIDYSINIYNERDGSDYRETDFFENVAVALNHFYGNQADEFGYVSIITDLRNAEIADITLYKVNNNTHDDERTVHGQKLTDVYSDPAPEIAGANLFFKKGVGVVAYIDDQQVLWTLVQ